VIVLGHVLMPAAPVGRRQDLVGGLLHRQDQAPQEAPYLRNTQRGVRPRVARNAPRLLRSCTEGRLFLSASTALVPARKTVNRAKAHKARVLWRYQPVQLRTS
jgi:hypothetical protein